MDHDYPSVTVRLVSKGSESHALAIDSIEQRLMMVLVEG